MKKLMMWCLLLVCSKAFSQDSLMVSPAGQKLQQYYLSLHIEQLWQSGHHINWQTGELNDDHAKQGIRTHCSAFAAAACKNVNIYILRPPQHGQVLLANAQFDWMHTAEATNDGWKAITGASAYLTAQQYANQGYVVAAVCHNPMNNEPGHIALVMPVNTSSEKVTNYGPEVIMASNRNYNYITMKAGFKHHITQWPEPSIQLYYNTKKPY